MDVPLDEGSEDERVQVVSQPVEPSFDEVLEVSGDDRAGPEVLHTGSPIPSDIAAGGSHKLGVEDAKSDARDSEPLRETSEDSTQQTTASSEDETVDPKPLPLPSFSADRYDINAKSLVIHSCRNSTFVRCGRKITTSYCAVKELHGIRCSRCFDV